MRRCIQIHSILQFFHAGFCFLSGLVSLGGLGILGGLHVFLFQFRIGNRFKPLLHRAGLNHLFCISADVLLNGHKLAFRGHAPQKFEQLQIAAGHICHCCQINQ